MPDYRKIGNLSQLCEVQHVQSVSGRSRGEELLLCSNGRLNFSLTVGHALDIYRLWDRGMNMGFVTKNGLTGFDDAFEHTFPAGMLYTCGLDNIGAARDGRPTHGRFHAIPADITGIRADGEGITVTGTVTDAALFGENILVRRTISTAFGSGSLTVTDELTNHGYCSQPYCMLYHVNAGWPLTDTGAVLEGEFETCIPRTDWAKEREATRLTVEEPADNMEETCYFYTLKRPSVTLNNPGIGRKMTVRYSGDTLPYLIEWKSRMSGDYVIGIEPCTSWLDGYLTPRVIEAGGTVVNTVTLDFD